MWEGTQVKALLAVVVRADNGSSPEQRRQTLGDSVDSATRFLRHAFPAREVPSAVTIWRDDETGTALLGWHNEPGEWHETTSHHTEGGAVEVVGYVDGEYNPDRALDAPDLLDFTMDRGGCFALVRARAGAIDAVTDSTNSNAVYWAETPSIRVVGTRALLVHLVAEHSKRGFTIPDPVPTYDLLALRHFPLAGFLLGQGTPFLGVTALSIAEHIRIDPWYLRFERRVPEAYGDIDYRSPDWRTLVEGTAEALVAAFEPVPGKSRHLAVTGGRDSRVLAAGLRQLSAGLTVTTSTMGMDEDPDVILAKLIARALGFPHSTRPPEGMKDTGVIRAEDPIDRAIRVLDVHDGMISAWDDVEDYGPTSPTPTMSGVGGEIIRGGLVLPHLDELTFEAAKTTMRNTLCGGVFYTQPFVESAKAFGAPLLDLCAHDPYRAIDDYYYHHRNARWVSSRRSGARFRRRTYDPLIDNRFIRLVRQVSPASRWNERLAFDLVATLAPELRDLPIEGHRWRFERFGPLSGPDGAPDPGWEKRAPLVRTAQTASYSWKTLKDPTMYSRLKDLVLDGMKGGVLDMLDRRAVERYLDDQGHRYPAVVWHLATLTIMVQTPWWRTTRPVKRELIPVLPE